MAGTVNNGGVKMSTIPANQESDSISMENIQPLSSTKPLMAPPLIRPIDDKNYSSYQYDKQITDMQRNAIKSGDLSYFDATMHANGLWKLEEIDYFDHRYRFGIMNPYQQISSAREYLFFTKPDLNIYPRSPKDGTPDNKLQLYLQTQPEWQNYAKNHFQVLKCLQASLHSDTPFNNLLGNTVSSNLEVPGLSSDVIESANSMFGVNIQYHGSSESSNDNFDFSLEFKDTKLLHVYSFFKAYEDYHTLMHHGVLDQWINYAWYHILNTQYSIYKFIVDDDAETIVYYGKAYGVYSKSLPRDVFTNTDFSDGISYSVDFHAAFYRDMNPIIIKEFNTLNRNSYKNGGYSQLSVWNEIFDRVDNRPAKSAYIETEYSPIYGRDVYKLRWKGDAKY